MTAPDEAPEWARELCVSFESAAAGQFVLYGNVIDRRALREELINVEDYVCEELLGDFEVVFTYDLGPDLPALAAAMVGISLRTLEQLVKVRSYKQEVLDFSELVTAKKRLIEHDACGLVEYVQSTRTLDDCHGQEGRKQWELSAFCATASLEAG